MIISPDEKLSSGPFAVDELVNEIGGLDDEPNICGASQPELKILAG